METRVLRSLSRILGPLALVGMLIAMYAAFIYAPREATMGDVYRILFIHVASAYNAYIAFGVVFLGSVLYLLRRHPRWDTMAEIAAQQGVLFTTLAILSGAFWARPVWNTWWTPDPRLTTTLIMWFMYIGYLVVRASLQPGEQRARLSAVFGIIAVITLPLVNRSVEWWRSLHPQILRGGDGGGMAMTPEMVTTLMIVLIAVALLNGYLLVKRLEFAQLRRRANLLREQIRQLRG